jgi:hypothetical protein
MTVGAVIDIARIRRVAQAGCVSVARDRFGSECGRCSDPPARVAPRIETCRGMTAAHRLQDMADVIQWIRVNQLPLEFAGRLNPYVADNFRELWQASQVDDDY